VIPFLGAFRRPVGALIQAGLVWPWRRRDLSLLCWTFIFFLFPSWFSPPTAFPLLSAFRPDSFIEEPLFSRFVVLLFSSHGLKTSRAISPPVVFANAWAYMVESLYGMFSDSHPFFRVPASMVWILWSLHACQFVTSRIDPLIAKAARPPSARRRPPRFAR